MEASKFTFTFFRFIGNGVRTTEIVRDFTLADGMRSLVERTPETVQLATQRVHEWATSKSMTLSAQDPFPSEKYPGKCWLEFRFGGLTL